MPDLQELRYPVGKFVKPEPITIVDRTHAMEVLAETPSLLREALRGLDSDQKNTPYREGGWTVRQVVHHVADSHMTGFHRVRRTLTEDVPTVTSYDEAAFAMLPDVTAPTEWSLELIEALHARWVMMLQGLDEAQWQRTYLQDDRPPVSVELHTLTYAWHSRHHVAHVTRLRAAQGW